jgi:alpha-glucosidase (family GH31 glycosyl hydrolase)
LSLVKEYLAYNIRVGAVNIDSRWSTGVNSFKWDTKKFPNATLMIDEVFGK